MNSLSLFALAAGAAIALQSAMNAKLGHLLSSPLLAACAAFSSSILFTLIAVIASTRHYPTVEIAKTVPVYLWFTGGLLSAAAISLFYYLIPQIGLGQTMTFALTGQLTIAMIAGHFGWFDVPVKPINLTKLLGTLALILGALLINKE